MGKNRMKLCVTFLFIFILCLNTKASNKVLIEGVPLINQHPELPTGCEITALTMLLQHQGVQVTKEQLAKEVNRVPVPYSNNGKLYGGDPSKGFIGDPFSKRGFGVYKDALLPIVEKYLPGRGEDLSGGDFSQVYAALNEGKPVMLWCTISMLNVDARRSYWTTPEGKTIEWKTPEHAMVAVGYDDDYIYLNDPYVGKQRKYKKQVVINRWSDMGKQAIAIKPSNALGKTPIIKKQSLMIEEIKYIDLLTVDAQGLWIEARMLPNLFKNTQVTYDPKTYSVIISTTGDKGAQMVLSPYERYLTTYNSSGQKVQMTYKIIDGITYVNKEWVEKFYELPIQILE